MNETVIIPLMSGMTEEEILNILAVGVDRVAHYLDKESEDYSRIDGLHYWIKERQHELAQSKATDEPTA